MKRRLVAALLPLAIAACSERTDRAPLGLSIEVAPLELEGIAFACYDLQVTGPAGPVVTLGTPGVAWTDGDDAICSWQYGNAAGGDIAYVAPCDADDGDDDAPAVADNQVTLWIDGLYRGPNDRELATDIGDWRDPCPDGCTMTFECRENTDTPVTFDITILRAARQGFFDMAVDFADIFCSAKLDCQDALLHDPATGERGPTAVFAMACTSGQGEEAAQPTFLYLDDIRVECGDPVTKTYVIDPSGGPGQVGGQPEGLFEVAHYQGKEQLPGIDKCFWNTAIGLDVETIADLGRLEGDCWLRGRGTATDVALVRGELPADRIYPVIEWNVRLSDAGGSLVCGDNPLNGDGSGVQTSYSVMTGDHFTCGMDCATGAVTCPGRVTCGPKPSVLGPVAITQNSGALTIQFEGNAYTYPIDPQYQVQGCCSDACCQEGSSR